MSCSLEAGDVGETEILDSMDMKVFFDIFGYEPQFSVTAPGRTELGGNHTDHQHGMVLAAPIDLSMKAWVSGNDTGIIRVYSEGYGMSEVRTEAETKPVAEAEAEIPGTAHGTAASIISGNADDYGTPSSIIRGMAAEFSEYGLAGFDAYVTSDIPAGSGLSRSAAFEILICRICCRLTGRDMTPVEMAKLGQYVENHWFGKPCGLMDQTACASDGIVFIDFGDQKDPVGAAEFGNQNDPLVRSIKFDFGAAGYDVCIVKCGAGHEDLTDNYAKITEELKEVCRIFGKEFLRNVPEEIFYENIAEVRVECGDRAVLRAMHVFSENKRVEAMCKALEDRDINEYLELVKESGRSSWELLQNVVPERVVPSHSVPGEGIDNSTSFHQDLAFTLAFAEKLLGGRGAVRVHGGGFAGTIQAYVPKDMTEEFVSGMESVLGRGSCILLNI